MKILLINPPLPLSTNLISKQYPLNIAYLGTYLEKRGFDISFIDLNIEQLSSNQLRKLVLKINPQVVGITVMTATFNNSCRIAVDVKEILPEVMVIVGGSHVSALPEETLKSCKAIDCVVVGEGEETFAEICERVKGNQSFAGANGVVYRANGSIKYEMPREFIKDLDTLPFPRRDYVDMRRYKKSHVSRGFSRKYLNIAEMILSRGCPGECIFCATNVTWRNKIRFRSIQNILAEIEYCRQEFDANHFSFEDDSFSFNRHWVELLCVELKKEKITWNCNLRVDMVTPDLLKLMSESGCRKVQFGIESGSQKILNLIQKNTSLEQVEQAVEWANQAKIRFIEGAFILGIHPDENLDDVLSTLQLIRRLKINLLMLSLACPFPGTKLYELVKNNSVYQEAKWEDFMFYGKSPVSVTKYLSGDQLVRLQRKAYTSFYLNPKLIWKTWNETRSLSEKCYWIRSGVNFLNEALSQKP